MLAIVQARLSSTRLPGKMLMDLCGKPLLARVVERLLQARLVRQVVVATSTDASDDAIAAFCARHAIKCQRGPLDDVAERFRGAAVSEAAQAFVRISGDSPLLDPALVDQAIRYYQHGDCDLVTNVFVRTFPKGQSVEVVRFAAFERLCGSMADDAEREHATSGFYAHPHDFCIVSFTSGMDAGSVNLSVDTPEDFARVQRLIETAGNQPRGWRELLDNYRAAVA